MEEILNKRIRWVDIAKGVAIVLVIVGHTVHKGKPLSEDLVRGLIFSFHMPLFFVLSNITTSLSNTEAQFLARAEKSFKRLIVPGFLVFFFIAAISAIKNGIEGSRRAYLAALINSFIYASGVDVATPNIRGMGMLWFLMVLFFGRTCYDYISLRAEKKHVPMICIAAAIVGYCFAKVQWLPFSTDLTLYILPFLGLGTYLGKYKYSKPSVGILLCSFTVWIVLFFAIYHVEGQYFELATRTFPMPIISYSCAVAGVVFSLSASKFIDNMPVISSSLSYIGSISMEIYLIHAMDGLFFGLWGVRFSNTYAIALARCIIDVLIAVMVAESKRRLIAKV